MFGHLHLLILNCNLYSEGEEWSDLLWSSLERGTDLQILQKSTEFLVELFKPTRPSPARPSVIEMDKDRSLVNHAPQKAPPIISLYGNHCILHSDLRWWSVYGGTATHARTLS